ncbi:hypothetical protein JTB14_002677 [Gonioctena quinquepunctata]|nr:hypothetical protein JTB14_002677 [Gonioctena quinquepunctata]
MPDKFADFGIGRHRGRRPRAPVPNYVSWRCTVCKKAQDTILPNDVIKDSIKQTFQKLSHTQERDQERTHRSPASDGDGRPPVSVTLEDRSDHEDITQQQDGTRDGRPPVPGTNISRPEDEVQDETRTKHARRKSAQQVIQKEQSCQPISPKSKESHSQVSPTPQKDVKGKSKILENQPSPIDNFEADKHLPNVNESERLRTMEADRIININKQLVNIETYIIKEADKHTNPDEEQGQAKTEPDDKSRPS